MIKHFLDNELYAMIAAIAWASLLVVIYSDGLANREYQYRLLTDSFNYHRTLRVDNHIGAVVPETPKVEETKVEESVHTFVEAEKPAKPINKIEIVHSMEPMSKTKESKN
jgi:hypothetical protein